jgi:hypothetical protein
MMLQAIEIETNKASIFEGDHIGPTLIMALDEEVAVATTKETD